MNKWNLQFELAQTEKEFNESYLEQELNSFRFSMILGFITYISFLTLDYQMYGAALFLKFAILRLSIAFLILTTYFLSFRIIDTPSQFQGVAIFIAISCFCSHIAFTFFEGIDNSYFYTATLILIAFIFNFLNIRFHNLIFVGIFYIVGHLLSLYYNFESVPKTLIHQAYGIIAVVFVSWIGIRIMENQKRQDFINKRLIESQKQELEAQKLILETQKLALEKNIHEKDKLVALLKERNQELDAFNYSVSHDLKSPLRNVSSFSKILERKYKHQLDDKATEYLNFIVNGASKMGMLIDDLLEYSKIRHTELQPKTLNFNLIVEKILLESTLALEKQPTIILNELPTIQGDKVLMTQVWENLISNAIKYSSKTEQPEIIIGAEQKANEIMYYIKDNGIGFDMKFADRLFQIFSRLHSDFEYVGTGVGLSLVDRIIKKHRGKIWAESEPNVGSTFYFTLPSNR